jgi:hypothetical protein
MTDDQRNGAPEEIVAADPSGIPMEVEPPPSPEANGGRRKGRKGAPKGKPGLRLPRRFKKAAPGSAAGIEPHELTAVPRTCRASSIGTGRSGRQCAGSTWTASATSV